MKLGRFLLLRIVNAIAITLLVALLTFWLVGRAPGDFLNELAANPRISHATLEQMRVQYALDSPFHIKFLHWVQTLLAGNLGYSLVYQRPIGPLVYERVWNTVFLNGLSLAVAWMLGLVLGVVAAARRGSALDWAIGAVSVLLLSVPAAVLSLLLLLLAARIGMPVGGMTSSTYETLSVGGRIADLLRHLALPVAAVAAALLPVIARHTRTAMAQALGAEYIRTARAKGLGSAAILLRHALRNALNPLTTLFGFSVSALLSASLIVEVLMSWPGIGQLTYDAVLRRDIFLVVDLAVLSAALLVIGNLIGDLLLYVSDPRISRG